MLDTCPNTIEKTNPSITACGPASQTSSQGKHIAMKRVRPRSRTVQCAARRRQQQRHDNYSDDRIEEHLCPRRTRQQDTRQRQPLAGERD